MSRPAILILEDGSIFEGWALGVDGEVTGELVFNTAMTGYQEILTDPSYAGQVVTLTYPHIGNTGVTALDEEADCIFAAGLVVHTTPPLASNWRQEQSLTTYLQRRNIIAIGGVDTRALTRLLVQKGSQKATIQAGNELSREKALELTRSHAGLKGLDLASAVSTSRVYSCVEGRWRLDENRHPQLYRPQTSVVVYDFGVKRSIMNTLVEKKCALTVVPAKTSAEEALNYQPEGILLSNGPGDPEACQYAVVAIRTFLQKDIPLFGICLGHQLLALAGGAKTEKMKFGHHGANHPVQDLRTGKVMITSQNHGFSVRETDLPSCFEITHRSLFDGTIQGIKLKGKDVFGFQGHPEASPGPHDALDMFDQFIACMQRRAHSRI